MFLYFLNKIKKGKGKTGREFIIFTREKFLTKNDANYNHKHDKNLPFPQTRKPWIIYEEGNNGHESHW